MKHVLLGRPALLAHREAIASDHQVGPYRVNLGVMDQQFREG